MGRREDGHRHVAQAVDDALHARADVPGNQAAVRRRGPRHTVEVVALAVGQPQRHGKRTKELR